MNSEQFVYWLNGFFELSGSKKLTQKQVQIIKDHLAVVFTKITPDYSKDSPSINPLNVPRIVPNTLSIPPYNPWIAPGLIPGVYPFEITCADTSKPLLPDPNIEPGYNKTYCSSGVKTGVSNPNLKVEC